MPHPELADGVFGEAHAHSLRVEDVDLEEVAGHQLLKPVQVPSLVHFARFHRSSFFINLGDCNCNTVDTACNNYSSDDIQWQGYLAINIIPFNSSAILT